MCSSDLSAPGSVRKRWLRANRNDGCGNWRAEMREVLTLGTFSVALIVFCMGCAYGLGEIVVWLAQ